MLILFVSVVLGSMTIIGPLLLVLAWMMFRSEKPARLQALFMALLGLILFATGVVSFWIY
jgi:hypothetical protein